MSKSDTPSVIIPPLAEAFRDALPEEQNAAAEQVAQTDRASGKSAEAEEAEGHGFESHSAPAAAPAQELTLEEIKQIGNGRWRASEEEIGEPAYLLVAEDKWIALRDMALRSIEQAAALRSERAAIPDGWKLLKNTTQHERSWTEDFGPENGHYFSTCCECGRQFVGHKRRAMCRMCATTFPIVYEEKGK